MPELPEVETTRRGVEALLTGATVRDVVVRNGALRWPVPPDLPAILTGQRIERVARRAKYLLIECAQGTLIIHLGMSGSLRFVDTGTPPEKHDHVDIVLDGGHTLRYRDPRRFGAVLWQYGDARTHPLLSRLGPEPLSGAFDGDVLYTATRKRSGAIKVALMDNALVVGVGNIYANEALFIAGVHPARAACELDRDTCHRLAEAVRDVLTRAIAAGGSTLRDFVDAVGKPGYFQQQYFVYGRTGLPCHRCGTPIRALRLAQRTAFFCPHCQPC
ncbi:bifunctional DNA-formamidopyrimidine glycosylase/DNA-(apurinic or apyrimidinic site) lyase [Crenobacter caeni]|uniref:Formamidopyrimidine-DNA glycosylase n=1 Tax=Crenobacter caeni TaxID=2705474 RepID=A0A6B2KTA5_9NEIS|nr:bifunctional DNA-formamidopyrimidine glycosylase/DNA-(apurinic or apyrimidinic site) lyase [Crenobacter caeni]NDV13263.1 bifunctional DNA-formamidopyrimidine glycosylase/DNA-(apurinic or apyrimidinic site) lyase [Crenobacter caeni]